MQIYHFGFANVRTVELVGELNGFHKRLIAHCLPTNETFTRDALTDAGHDIAKAIDGKFEVSENLSNESHQFRKVV